MQQSIKAKVRSNRMQDERADVKKGDRNKRGAKAKKKRRNKENIEKRAMQERGTGKSRDQGRTEEEKES